MRFLFVDRITEISEKVVKGEKFFPADDSMQYINPFGGMQIAPGIVTEAVGQMVSWLCLRNNDFSAKPVFISADGIQIYQPVKPGTLVKMEGEIEEVNEQTFIFSGRAYVDDQLVQAISRSSGYFMPLADLENPEFTRERFNDLVGDGLILQDNMRGYDFDSMIDEVVELVPGVLITAQKQMRDDEPFYADHFPRFPVTPIVMINEMIRNTALRLVEAEGGKYLLPLSASNIKIKSFIQPGEICLVNVSVTDRHRRDGYDVVDCLAEISKDGKKILRGKYEYRVFN